MNVNENKVFKYLSAACLLGIVIILIITSKDGYDDKSIGNIKENKDVLSIETEKGKVLSVGAEKTGSSPESGATSRLKQAYDWLDSKGNNYGNSQPTDYPYDNGTYWNRILYSAFWEPDGTATESDVLSGKTFYSGSNNRVQRIGTLDPETSPGAYYEQFVEYDDHKAGDYTGEESTWTNTNALSGSQVWYDTRTGLYWARSQPTTLTNSFSSPSTGECAFFTSIPRSYYFDDGGNEACGDAIDICSTLSLASTQGQSADTDWYLPSQKELQDAYANGISNQTSDTFATTRNFWSSTEYTNNSTYAWYVTLATGYTYRVTKTTANAVRCVRRD